MIGCARHAATYSPAGNYALTTLLFLNSFGKCSVAGCPQLRDLLVDTPKRLDIRQTAASGLNVPDATQVPSRLAFTALSAAFASSVHLQALTAGKPARRARARCSTRNPVDERNRNYRRMKPCVGYFINPYICVSGAGVEHRGGAGGHGARRGQQVLVFIFRSSCFLVVHCHPSEVRQHGPVVHDGATCYDKSFVNHYRATAGTKMNERSSRSHSVLSVIVDGVSHLSGAATHGCLHLIDLAGELWS